MNKKHHIRNVQIEIPNKVLESVFEECDRYECEETGGRMVGHFAREGNTLLIRVQGVIEPGPNAKRTRTSFFQDGEYQTQIFRNLEARDPSIEHLGNWHTHHVNGYPQLSNGDITTYRRIVNHELHNLDFFYALLVTQHFSDRDGLERYAVRHYVLYRGDEGVFEVGPESVHIVDAPRIWPKDVSNFEIGWQIDRIVTDNVRTTRARDQEVFNLLYPSLKPRLGVRSGTLFWKGTLPLVDGTAVELRVLEIEDDSQIRYYIRTMPANHDCSDLCNTPFTEACKAVRALELCLNSSIYECAVKREI